MMTHLFCLSHGQGAHRRANGICNTGRPLCMCQCAAGRFTHSTLVGCYPGQDIFRFVLVEFAEFAHKSGSAIALILSWLGHFGDPSARLSCRRRERPTLVYFGSPFRTEACWQPLQTRSRAINLLRLEAFTASDRTVRGPGVSCASRTGCLCQ
jgi:hypothetical protein